MTYCSKMKYFKLSRMTGGGPDFHEAAEAYRTYLASIRGSLPTSLCSFLDSFSLRDANFEGSKLVVPRARMVLHLSGYNYLAGKRAGKRYFRLAYEGVVSVQTSQNVENEALLESRGFDCVAHDEFEIL